MDKVANCGTVPKTHGVSRGAARCLGGFGVEEKEQECEEGEEGELAKSEDFEVFGEEQHSIEDAPRTRKVQADAKKLADLSAAQDALEQLPDELVEQFHATATRAGRARKKSRKAIEAEKDALLLSIIKI